MHFFSCLVFILIWFVFTVFFWIDCFSWLFNIWSSWYVWGLNILWFIRFKFRFWLWFVEIIRIINYLSFFFLRNFLFKDLLIISFRLSELIIIIFCSIRRCNIQMVLFWGCFYWYVAFFNRNNIGLIFNDFLKFKLLKRCIYGKKAERI